MRFASPALACLALLLPACGSRADSQPLVIDPLPPRRGRSSATVAASASASAPASAADAEPAPVPDPEAARLFLEHYAAPALPLLPDVRPSRVLGLAFEGSVRGETAGMSAEGARFGATLAEGQRAWVPVSYPVGACVTVVAQGGLGVVEVDVFLTTGEPAPMRIVAQDARTGPTAVIGGKDDCFSFFEPFIGNLSVTVRKGSGMVLVQQFRPVTRER
ncbi:hypothetical protein [Polyangium mundeleinium]|uniref:Lipoprotein n=1 Tax=Polyangium mundeleinium TaxID=2995306 RepID=A0ABT5F2R7_9BACT|nr:hypothetical protein [Polyangium mundeleinium]MDC0747371.1 hypothetical protein [Polyangium mundeleinium]